MNMNQAEIEWAASVHHECPNVRRGLHLLLALVEAVNDQSDGWAYWSAPSHASDKLQRLLQSTGNLYHGTHERITAAQLAQAITPIRAMVTRQRAIQAKYGNKFDFDVDAALAAPLAVPAGKGAA
jgi:hypothetical protein